MTKTNEGEKFRGGTKERRNKEDQVPKILSRKCPGLSEGVLPIGRDAALIGVDYRKQFSSFLFHGGDVNMTIFKKF